MASKKQIADALYEVRHYQELAQESYEDGDLESAEGWLTALCEEAVQALLGEKAA